MLFLVIRQARSAAEADPAISAAADIARGKTVEAKVLVPPQPVQTAENAGAMVQMVTDVIAGKVDALVK